VHIAASIRLYTEALTTSVQVNPQFYAFRWITLLLTQAKQLLLLLYVHNCSPALRHAPSSQSCVLCSLMLNNTYG
jgi:hypothetical protein